MFILLTFREKVHVTFAEISTKSVKNLWCNWVGIETVSYPINPGVLANVFDSRCSEYGIRSRTMYF